MCSYPNAISYDHFHSMMHVFMLKKKIKSKLFVAQVKASRDKKTGKAGSKRFTPVGCQEQETPSNLHFVSQFLNWHSLEELHMIAS